MAQLGLIAVIVWIIAGALGKHRIGHSVLIAQAQDLLPQFKGLSHLNVPMPAPFR